MHGSYTGIKGLESMVMATWVISSGEIIKPSLRHWVTMANRPLTAKDMATICRLLDQLCIERGMSRSRSAKEVARSTSIPFSELL